MIELSCKTKILLKGKVFRLTSILVDLHEKIQAQSRVMTFIQRFNLANSLKSSGFTKEKGVKLIKLIGFVISLIFTQKNLYEYLRSAGEDAPFKRDTVYRLLNNPNSNWRYLVLKLGATIISFLKHLTSDKRVCALIVDDSAYYRDRSKKVELLARVKDHTTNRYFKGFRKLTVGWTDGATFIPLIFALLSSSEAKNRLYEQGPEVPTGSPGQLRRQESIQKATDVLLDSLSEILTCVKDFQYVLFDSWFSWPKVIKGVKAYHRDVICMLKDMPTLFYTYQGKNYTLSKLYAQLDNKHFDKSSYIASIVVNYYGISARVVFVRNRNSTNKREWLALLSTDITITEEEIIRIYGLRWDIEVYFKVCKSFLGLAKEYQGRSYDSMVAHTAIVTIRYMILSIETRENQDNKAHGGMFYEFCDEIKSLEFREAFLLIVSLFMSTLRENLFLTKEMIDKILTNFINKLPGFMKRRLGLASA